MSQPSVNRVQSADLRRPVTVSVPRRPSLAALGLLALLGAVLAEVLTSCGAGPQTAGVASGAGTSTVTILWPSESRLIPLASQSIRASYFAGTTQLQSQLLPRPSTGGTTTATFSELPVGTLTFTATAYPNADGTGVAQATASTQVTIRSGQTTPVSVSMVSTIDHLELSPGQSTLAVGGREVLTMAARDASGNIVLVSPSALRWSSDSGSAQVDAAGSVTGMSSGPATITVTDTEPGKSTSAMVAVGTQTSLPGIVAWWKGAGNTIDSVGGNNGAWFGTAAYAPSVCDQGFYFDGASGVAIPDSPTLALTQSLSISAWVNLPRYPSTLFGGTWQGQIFFRGDDRVGLDPYDLRVTSAGHLEFKIQNASNQTDLLGVPIATGQFVHVAATLDDATGTMALYENGQLVSLGHTNYRPFGALDPTEHPGEGIGNLQFVGGPDYPEPLIGTVSDVQIYNRALSAQEVQTLYQAGLTCQSQKS